jgi:hypothetical protein
VTENTGVSSLFDLPTNGATAKGQVLSNFEINLTPGENQQFFDFQTENPLSPIIAEALGESRETPENVENPSSEAIAQSETGIAILSPSSGTILNVPATPVIVQFPQGTEIELLVNGNPVSSEAIGQTQVDSNGIVTQTWYGIPLQPGENAIAIGVIGSTVTSNPITVIVQGGAAQIAVETIEKRVPADGRSIVNIQGRLLDETGNFLQRDTEITLSASAGEFIGEDLNPDRPGFQVPVIAGEFTAQLQSPLDAQTVRIRAATDTETLTGRPLEAFTQMELTCDLDGEDWIIGDGCATFYPRMKIMSLN